MPRRTITRRATPPHRVEFHRTKYGRELLVDAAFVRQMPTFRATSAAHALDFHDILLVTRGQGRFVLDGKAYPVAAGADHLGFADPAYFARFFRREAGCPPAAFRRSE